MRRRYLGVVIVGVLAAAAAVSATAGGAATSVHRGPIHKLTNSTSTNWSDGGNWSGSVAPVSNASIGTLSFPFVSSCPSGSACAG